MNGREAAFRALAAFRKSGAWPGAWLAGPIKSGQLDSREAAFASKLTLSVMQNRRLLDYWLASASKIPLEKLDPAVLDILRLSLCQMAFFDRVPDSAAVNEGVKLAKKYSNSGAAGFINAVLRVLSRNGLPEPDRKNAARYLSVKYSYPDWMTEMFIGRLGEDGCEAFFKASNSEAPLSLHVNTLRADADGIRAELEAEGMSVRDAAAADCLDVEGCGDVTALDAFRRGDIWVQDSASAMTVDFAGLEPGMFVVDGCAAPGGKSFAAAVNMKNRGHIVSCDIHENKLRLIREGAERLGIDIIETRANDGRKPVPELVGRADACIADVPCSGLGVIRKKPDIRYKTAEEIQALPPIQLGILRGLSQYVKVGGLLIYSTCTLVSRENEEVVEAFLREREDFRLEDSRYLWPHIDGTDGFFMSRMRRK
ncbi:MAG: 16S rRNA (cytosine(967)-C(5))-methyltransferase RsmB [Oscillospiraceae bacterium]|nr:16S rRNA (cytosine(967)-C(5))-methyltransferase RsmB [Oscillospiraceae bacterium]